MIQKIRKFIVIGVASLTLMTPAAALPLVGGLVAADNITTQLCGGVDAASGDQNCNSTTNTTDAASGIKGIATTIVNVFSVIVGAAAVIMIIYGGFRYITSGGDSGKVGNAKNTLIYAIIGLVIVALAQLIVRYVLTQSSNASAGFDSGS